jgi:tetratricopeptide (TPR) repeat protein
MAEISLREYLGKLDTLLRRGDSSQVIHHCRHILQHYPKNAEAYRLLGRALVYNSNWEQAGEVLRRVLAVYPDDLNAHVGLSEVYLNTRQTDEAIWHLERAFEQDPNNREIIEQLRELYRRHRRVEHAKVQLTAGAVARQYIRNGLYEQAIDTLRQSLARFPDRADLRLLLAETYHDAGLQIEAGETALEVLRTLPDCLEANRILTELWLSQGRPSDAQRYLNRLQPLDSYLALQLAQGTPPPDDTFRLEELDYRRSAEREMVSQSPNWLQDIGPVEDGGQGEWLGSFAQPAEQTDEDMPVFKDDAFSTELPDDWLTDVPKETPRAAVPPPTTTSKHTGKTGLLSSLDEPKLPDRPVEESIDDLFGDDDFLKDLPSSAQSLDNLFPAEDAEPAGRPLQQTSADLPNLDDLFGDQAEADMPALDELPPAAPKVTTGALADSDPLAWLRDTGVELDDQAPARQSLLPDDEDVAFTPVAEEANPLAWMQDFGGDQLMSDEAPARPVVQTDSVAPEEEADPLDWLQDFGGDQLLSEESSAETPAAEAASPTSSNWLTDESLLDEALNLEELIDQPPTGSLGTGAVPTVAPAQEPEEDDLDWMAQFDDEPAAASVPAETPDWAGQPGASGDEEDPLDWMSNLDEPVSQADTEAAPMSDWFSQAGPDDEPEPESTDATPDWLNAYAPASETPAASPEDAGLDWMSSLNDDEPADADAEPAESAMPDWLSQSAPSDEAEEDAESATASADAGLDWMSSLNDDEPADADAEPAESAMPDWLSQSAPSDEAEEDAESATASADAGLDWMSSLSDDEPADEEAEPAESAMPDWLSQSAPSDEAEADAEPIAASADAGLDWMSSLSDDEPADEEAEPAESAMPDWLSQSAPSDEAEADAEPIAASADAGLDWMSSLSDDEPADEEAEPAESAMPDWLSQSAPSDEAEEEAEPIAASADAGLDWMSSLSDDEPADEEAEPAESAMPDWLSQSAPSDEAEEEAEPIAASAEDSGFDWTSSLEDDLAEVEEEPAEVGDTPDWLTQFAPSDEAQPDAEPVASTEDAGFEWMSELNAENETPEDAEPAAAGESPDWLSELSPSGAPEAEADAEPVAAAAEDSGFEWMSELNAEDETPEDAEPAAAGETPDWLSELAPSSEGEVDAEPEPAAAEADMPDWLSELSPSSDREQQTAAASVASESDEETAQGEVVPDWLSALQSESNRTPTEAEPEPASGGWIDDMDKPEPVEAFDFSETQPASEEEPLEPTPASNAPDWLNAMVPGLDVDYEAEEDQPLEPALQQAAAPKKATRDFDWLTDIVEEESQQITTVTETPKPERRRFVFSRPPVWLRQTTERNGGSDTPDDDLDLPPWLQ